MLAAAEIRFDPFSTASMTKYFTHVRTVHVGDAGDIVEIRFAIEEPRDARVGNEFEGLGKDAFDGFNAPIGTIEANAEVLLGVGDGSLSKCLDVLLACVFHGHTYGHGNGY